MELVGMASVLGLLFLAIGGVHAYNHDIENYWHSVLPNTVMPKPLKNLIHDGKVDFQAGLHSNFDPVQLGNSGQYHYGIKARGKHTGLWEKLLMMNETLYFFEKDLRSGANMMSLRFVSQNGATFLPRQVADSLPFTSTKFPQILKQFSVKPESNEAKQIKDTLLDCEQPLFEGEHKRCATSLESMIDFSVSELGRSVKVLATEVEAAKKNQQKQNYRVIRVSKVGKDSVQCHKVYYGYAVYYCHKIEATRSYVVSLVGENGSKVKALAVCHTDTSAWDPGYPAFKILKVKPGIVPICHFLAQDNLVWVAN